jgi:hypothetical protein
VSAVNIQSLDSPANKSIQKQQKKEIVTCHPLSVNHVAADFAISLTKTTTVFCLISEAQVEHETKDSRPLAPAPIAL